MILELAQQLSQLGLNNKSLGVLERNGFTGDKSYNQSEDEKQVDQFGPCNTECFKLPNEIKVTFIATEDECKQLSTLISKDIGIDCEWRP